MKKRPSPSPEPNTDGQEPSPDKHPRKRSRKGSRIRVGWREWVDLPDLSINAIKAKLDTGARTSALHVSHVRWHEVDGKDWVEFDAHPVQYDDAVVQRCWARAIDRRWVTNPGGRREKRFVIRTRVKIGGRTWPIDLSLTNRDDMGFRLLLGRAAMQRRLVLDPSLSYHTRRIKGAAAAPGEPRATRKRRKKSDEEE